MLIVNSHQTQPWILECLPPRKTCLGQSPGLKEGPFVLLTAASYYLQLLHFTLVHSQSRISIAILTFEFQELEADSAAECVFYEIVASPFSGDHAHLMQ